MSMICRTHNDKRENHSSSGGSILQSSGSKPLTIQRMTSLEGAEMKGGQVILQRAQSVETSEASAAASMLQQHVGPGSPQVRGGHILFVCLPSALQIL